MDSIDFKYNTNILFNTFDTGSKSVDKNKNNTSIEGKKLNYKSILSN
jgi:hypothetical protein